MPAQKNQHFVPRCALKAFTLNAEGAAINVFNIERNRTIQNAAVKGQCARVYLYGADLTLENMLVTLEGQYARIATNLAAGRALDDADHEWLYLFAIVQFRRTTRAIEEMREFTEHMANVVFKNHPEQRPTDERTDREMSPQLCVIWYDRGVYTVPNASGTPFVEITKVADAAAINEWHVAGHDRRAPLEHCWDFGFIRNWGLSRNIGTGLK
jgi:hypothetical protein